MSQTGKKAGTVALVGRPNAGKSTLMNSCLAEKLAIVSDKPQTTRHRLVGILTSDRGQMVFYDTPGIHKPRHRLNRQMVQYATEALRDADVICLMIDVTQPFGPGDRYMIDLLSDLEEPKIVVLNKIDRISKPDLLPLMARYSRVGGFDQIVPTSALSGDGVAILIDILWDLLPVGAPFYDSDLLTVHPERFLVAERIREKILFATRDELPFSTAVVIENWAESPDSDNDRGLLWLNAVILVDRPGQKKILVGQKGQMIRKIGIAARQDLEHYLGRQVHLELYVRHQPGWRESPRILASLEQDLAYGAEE